MGKTLIIAAFPGTGKSYYTSRRPYYSKQILDSDSSMFSWTYNFDGTRDRNTDFPKNYINYIDYWSYHLQKYPVMDSDLPLNMNDISGIIFTSTHKTVLEGLTNAHLPYYIVVPKNKADVFARYNLRNDTPEFIENMKKNYDQYMADVKYAADHDAHVKLVEVDTIEQEFNKGTFK